MRVLFWDLGFSPRLISNNIHNNNSWDTCPQLDSGHFSRILETNTFPPGNVIILLYSEQSQAGLALAAGTCLFRENKNHNREKSAEK